MPAGASRLSAVAGNGEGDDRAPLCRLKAASQDQAERRLEAAGSALEEICRARGNGEAAIIAGEPAWDRARVTVQVGQPSRLPVSGASQPRGAGAQRPGGWKPPSPAGWEACPTWTAWEVTRQSARIPRGVARETKPHAPAVATAGPPPGLAGVWGEGAGARKLLHHLRGRRPRAMIAAWLEMKTISHLKAASMKP